MCNLCKSFEYFFFWLIYICLLVIGIDFEGIKRIKVELILERIIKKRICFG